MDRKTKPTDEVSLIKADFVNIRVTGPIITIRDLNFYKRGELEPIPNPLLVLLIKRTTYTPRFIRSRRRHDLKDATILGRRQTALELARLDLTFP